MQAICAGLGFKLSVFWDITFVAFQGILEELNDYSKMATKNKPVYILFAFWGHG